MAMNEFIIKEKFGLIDPYNCWFVALFLTKITAEHLIDVTHATKFYIQKTERFIYIKFYICMRGSHVYNYFD